MVVDHNSEQFLGRKRHYSEKNIKILSIFSHSRKYTPAEIWMHLLVHVIFSDVKCKHASLRFCVKCRNPLQQKFTQNQTWVLTHFSCTSASERDCMINIWSVTIIWRSMSHFVLLFFINVWVLNIQLTYGFQYSRNFIGLLFPPGYFRIFNYMARSQVRFRSCCTCHKIDWYDVPLIYLYLLVWE